MQVSQRGEEKTASGRNTVMSEQAEGPTDLFEFNEGCFSSYSMY